MECNFDTEGVTKTIYYDIEQDNSVESNDIRVVYGSLPFVEELVKCYECTQSFKLTCKPPESLVAQHETIGDNRGYWHCLCVRYIIDSTGNW